MEQKKQNVIRRAKQGLVGILMGAGASIVPMGCAEMTDADLAAVVFGISAEGARQQGNPGAGFLLDSAAGYTAESGRRQHERNVARDGRSQININVGESQQYKNFSVEIINLDKGEKEIEVTKMSYCMDYLLYRAERGDFPERGYLILKKENGRIVEQEIMKKEEDTKENCIWITVEGEKIFGRSYTRY